MDKNHAILWNYKGTQMTKFETLLKLSEIKGQLIIADNMEHLARVIEEVNELIDDLKDDDECPGFGPAYNDSSVDRCHGCGQFHD